MSAPRSVGVVLFGVGGVGRALVHQITKSRVFHRERYGIEFNLMALCDSSGCLSRGGKALSDSTLESASKWKRMGKTFGSHQDGTAGASEDVLPLLQHGSIAVDCSAAGESITKVLLAALNQGAGVAMANKKPLTLDQSYYQGMTTTDNIHRLKYESTVGAGTPMVASLQRLLASGDSVSKIQGTFSGTLGYLMTGLSEGKPYSAVVQEAFDLGYTEPDPRDDLGGVDVGRKALILARTLGWQMEMADVSIEPLFPPEMADLPVPDFMAALPSLDGDYAAKVASAAEHGQVLRYAATIQGGRCDVGLKALDADSPIGRLMGSENMVEFYTSAYGEKPLVVQGAGAGGEITATGVLADMVDLAAAQR